MIREHEDDWEQWLVPALSESDGAEMRTRAVGETGVSVEERVLHSSLRSIKREERDGVAALFLFTSVFPEDVTIPAAVIDALAGEILVAALAEGAGMAAGLDADSPSGSRGRGRERSWDLASRTASAAATCIKHRVVRAPLAANRHRPFAHPWLNLCGHPHARPRQRLRRSSDESPRRARTVVWRRFSAVPSQRSSPPPPKAALSTSHWRTRRSNGGEEARSSPCTLRYRRRPSTSPKPSPPTCQLPPPGGKVHEGADVSACSKRRGRYSCCELAPAGEYQCAVEYHLPSVSKEYI